MPDQTPNLPRQAEVVVIGGGVVGAACAMTLAKQGVDVCLLERDDIGAGTTRAAAAAALLQTKTSPVKLALASRSLKMLFQFYQETERSFEFAHTGSLLAACNETELIVVKDMVSKLQQLGLEVSYVDGDEARRMMPVIGPQVIGASYSPVDAKINPLELVTSYVRAAQSFGARIFTFTPVTGVETFGERIEAVITGRGRIHTATVVDAAGVWTAELGEKIGVSIPVVPLKGELLVTEACPPQMRGTLIAASYLLSKTSLEKSKDGESPKRSVGITLVQVDHGNFIVGSTRQVAGFDRRSSYAGVSEMCRQLVQIAPQVANLHLIRSYAGLRPITPDGMPVISRAPGLPGFIVAAGHGGDGLILSAITAEMVADIYFGRVDAADLAPYDLCRFNPTQAL